MKQYKLFGIKILEIIEDKDELPLQEKPKGFVLDDTPESIKKAQELEILKKYEK